ncbi:MAG: hypothetical protein ABIT01_05885 [Thermoanaerobaculia bacterium]
MYYTANPALELADLKSQYRFGQGLDVRGRFTGSGLNDLWADWDYSGGFNTFDVVIDGTSSPNTFKWRKNGGSYTTLVAMTGVRQLLSDGAYVLFRAKTGHTLNDAWSITTPPDRINWPSVGVAAAYCDERLSDAGKRWECHLALRDQKQAEEWERTIGLHFGGRWQNFDGQQFMVVNRPTSTIAMTVTTDQIVGTPTCRRGTSSGLLDAPNKITVNWTDPLDAWKEKPSSDMSSDAKSGGDIREGSPYALLGCQRESQAKRHVAYILNGIQADFLVNFTGTPACRVLRPGDRIQLTDDSVSLSAQDLTVLGVFLDDTTNTVRVECVEYNAAVWSDVPGQVDTLAAAATPVSFGVPSTVPVIGNSLGINTPGVSTILKNLWFEAPRSYLTATLYDYTHWSANPVTLAGWDPAKVNDGITSVDFGTLAAGANVDVVFDAGVGNTVKFQKYVLTGTTMVPPSTIASAQTVQGRVSYSDDGSTWTYVLAPSNTGFSNSTTVVTAEWEDVATHRYWKLNLTQQTGTAHFRELQFYVASTATTAVINYEIWRNASVGSGVLGDKFATIPAALRPTSTSDTFSLVGLERTVENGSVFTTYVEGFVIAVSSAGRSVAAYFAWNGSTIGGGGQPAVTQSAASPTAAQPGSLYLGGEVRSAANVSGANLVATTNVNALVLDLADSTEAVSGANSFRMRSRSGGTPQISIAGATYKAIITSGGALGTPASGDLVNCTFPTLAVATGGTGVVSLTAYAPIFGGTTTTNPVQAGTVGSLGEVLTSNGAGAIPTFKAVGSGAGGGQFVRIAQVTTTGSQATVDFASIPSTYTDLEIRYQARSNVSATSEAIRLKFNADGTSGNYTITQYVAGNNNSASASTLAAAATGLYVNDCSGANAPANHPSVGVIRIDNYKGTVFYKHMESYGSCVLGAGAAQEAVQLFGGVWKSLTATNQLTFSVPTSFVNGSVWTLYGIG